MRYVRPRVKKSRRRYISSNGKSKRKCWYAYTYQVRIYVVPGSIPFCSSTRRWCELSPFQQREVIIEDGIYPLSVAHRFLGYVLVLLRRCTRVYVQQYYLYCFFFFSAIETLIVIACHVLFVTTVWISENELRESINIIMMLISAHVLLVLYS